MPIRVLVTDADTPKALAIVRAIGSTAEIWTAAESRISLAGSSRYTRKHLKYGFNALKDLPDWVLSTCQKHGISVVIPPEESSSLLLARREEELNRHGIRVASLPRSALEIAMDKAQTIRAAAQCGIPLPPSRVLNDPRNAVETARELGYPVVVKPRFSCYWDGRRFVYGGGVTYANSDDQVIQAVSSMDPAAPPPIVQSFIPGKGLGVCVLVGNSGEVCAEFAHERLRDFRPTGSGSVLRKSVPVDSRLREMSIKLLRHIGCRGVAMVEFRTDERNGGICLMEINGRFWGSLQLAVEAGVNFPALLLKTLVNEHVEKPSYRTGVHVRWWIGDLIRTLRVMKGRPAGYAGKFPSRIKTLMEFLGPQPRGTKNEVMQWNDCWPCIIEPILMARKLFR